jgi:PAS domain S-box-containing protein
MYGYAASEMQCKSSAIPRKGGDDERPGTLARIRRGEPIANQETIRRHKDGRTLCVSLAVSRIFDSAGALVALADVLDDARPSFSAPTE